MRQLRVSFPSAASNRRGWLLGECGGCRKVPAASCQLPCQMKPAGQENVFISVVKNALAAQNATASAGF